jgi:NADPH:quinone reductase-like Zn-dependent oxidoreductase
MKCYELQGPAGVEGLKLVDRSVPVPSENQVLVRIKAATLNYRDLLTIKGGYGSRQKFPLIPVSDGAGVVESIGAEVRHFEAGDRVVGSFFENWVGGEPSEAKMQAALGGAVDGVLAEYAFRRTRWSRRRSTSTTLKPRRCPAPGSRPGAPWSSSVARDRVRLS